MIVHEAETPSGELIRPSEHRKYTVSGREFSYTAPACEIITFDNALGLSGSWEHGLAAVVQGDKFYHKRFSKDAQNFRIKSPFWKNASGSFNLDVEYTDVMHVDECFTWFNIGQYWHWFLEDLPLVTAFAKYPNIPIYTNHLTQWQLDSLDYFPDIKKRVIQVDTPVVIKGKIRVVTYPAISYRGKAARWVVDFLKMNLEPDFEKNNERPQRIYISRNDAVARNVRNEAEVIDMLVNDYDFTPINTHKENSMSGMSLREKINMFSAAKVVVSPTGAGLTHTHAMSSGSVVVDFNHPFEVSEECGWNNIGDGCGLKWHTLVAETLDMPAERPKLKNSHMRVNVKELKEVLDHALSKAS